MGDRMESQIFVAIIVICVVLILIGFIKHQFDLIVNFGLRIFSGLLAIYLINVFIGRLGFQLEVGTNGVTALVMGLLGLPGLFLLYGTAFYFYIT